MEVSKSAAEELVEIFGEKNIEQALRSRNKAPNPLTLYLSTFIGDDGTKKACLFQTRPQKKLLHYLTFVSQPGRDAVMQVEEFCKRNKITEYKLVD
jgi:hypothetical protein